MLKVVHEESEANATGGSTGSSSLLDQLFQLRQEPRPSRPAAAAALPAPRPAPARPGEMARLALTASVRDYVNGHRPRDGHDRSSPAPTTRRRLADIPSRGNPANIEQQRVNDERQRTQRRRSGRVCAGRWPVVHSLTRKRAEVQILLRPQVYRQLRPGVFHAGRGFEGCGGPANIPRAMQNDVCASSVHASTSGSVGTRQSSDAGSVPGRQ